MKGRKKNREWDCRKLTTSQMGIIDGVTFPSDHSPAAQDSRINTCCR